MAEGASLTVMGGPMAGTSLVIDDAVDEVLIGADPDCRLSLDLPGVSPIHARVWRDLGGMTVFDTRSPRGLYVNDERVVDQAPLHDGDVLWLGAPGDPDSVMLQCRLPEEGVLGAPVPDAAEYPVDAPVESAAEALVDVPAEPWVDVPAAEHLVPAAAAEEWPSDPFPIDEAPDSRTVAIENPFLAIPTGVDLPPADEPRPTVAIPTAVAPTTAVPAVAAAAAPFAADPGLDDFVMDPSWSDDASPAAPPAAPPPPLDLESLLGDDDQAVAIPPSGPEPAVAIPPSEPAPAVAAPPPPAPVPAAAAAPAAPARQTGGAPPLTPPPQSRPDTGASPARPTPRPFPSSARREAPEGVMDWARGTSPAEAPAVPPVRPGPRPSRRPEPAGGGSRRLLPVAGAIVLVAALAGGYFAWTASRTPRIDGVSPPRAAVGSVITLTGKHLGDSAGEASVQVGGRPARVVQAGGGRLQIELPELATTAGRDASVPIVVTTGGRESKPAAIAVYQAPRLTSVVPDLAMPGQRVVLAGALLGPGSTVRFGDAEALVVEATAGSLTVTVPPLAVVPGTEVPVVASTGPDSSNALDFMVGQAPLVTAIEPRSVSPGDLITVVGRGFDPRALANRVRVGGTPALVVNAGPRGLEFVVPRVIGGGETATIAVEGSPNVVEEALSISSPPEPIGFAFVAEPFEDVPGHEHAAVSTGLGPAFILTAAQGKTAAERAYEAQQRLNEAGGVLRSTRTAEIRSRLAPAPAVYLVSRDTVLLAVTDADAASYNEDWARKGAGPAVTPVRLVTWWEAVARDLVLLLLRGEKPSSTSALAREGKAFTDLHDAARRSVAVGVPGALVTGARSPMRDALRNAVLRVPASVTAAVSADRAASAADPAASAADPAVPAAATAPPFELDGRWRGHETESGIRKPINMVFAGGSGTLTYERALSMSLPVLAVEQPQKGAVRFEIRVGGGTRHYRGQWDGARITGTMTSDPDGRNQMGTFELARAR